ncbi:MAG: hypothetical protein NC402_01090 [Prevotella sp.]|nr:hypothetical protein [Prevotella sp.]MCM1075471.1 hypothetical protein [Ruminococcus sp.]
MKTTSDNILNPEMKELEALRSQMAEMRKRLNSQQLVSDTLLRDVIKRSTDYSRRYFYIKELIMVPVGIICIVILHFTANLPIWFVIATTVILIAELLADWQITKLARLDYGTTPLLEIQQRLTHQKKMRTRRMLAGMLILVVWLAVGLYVVYYEMYPVGVSNASTVVLKTFRYSIGGGAAIGGTIGLIFGLSAYRRMQRENSQAIARLQEFTN